MLYISPSVSIQEQEIELNFIHAQGSGGQNVNKVSSAVHLRFDIRSSSLPEKTKDRLLAMPDRRLNKNGIIVIKAQQHRSQEKNRTDALERLRAIIAAATKEIPKRHPTKPGKNARKKRLEGKKRRGQLKANRKKIQY